MTTYLRIQQVHHLTSKLHALHVIAGRLPIGDQLNQLHNACKEARVVRRCVVNTAVRKTELSDLRHGGGRKGE
jgi:hypothetical protein